MLREKKELSALAQEALDRAVDLARADGSACCTTGHLIYGLLGDHLSLGNRIFDDIKIYPEMFRDHLKKLPKQTEPGKDDGLHALIHEAIKRGKVVKKSLGGGKEIATDHVLLGLLSLRNGSAHDCLVEFSVHPDEISKELVEAMGYEASARPTF